LRSRKAEMKKTTATVWRDQSSLAKLAVLPLKSLHLLGHIARQARSFAAAELGLLTHSCSVAGEQPILAAMDETPAHRDGCLASWSSTIRMAR
jgi:hypothetical protein